MKASLLFERHQLFITESGKLVEVHMDLYKIKEADAPDGSDLKYSWIAFDPDNPIRRVLFDAHPPKGPHFHIDEDSDGEPFEWKSVDAAIQLFHEKVTAHFGELVAVPDDGGQK
jgi:hypothetical protein